MRTYTKPEILRAVRDQMKTWDTGRKHINDALMLSDLEARIIGVIDMALPEPVKEFNHLGARVGKIYPRVKA